MRQTTRAIQQYESDKLPQEVGESSVFYDIGSIALNPDIYRVEVLTPGNLYQISRISSSHGFKDTSSYATLREEVDV